MDEAKRLQIQLAIFNSHLVPEFEDNGEVGIMYFFDVIEELAEQLKLGDEAKNFLVKFKTSRGPREFFKYHKLIEKDYDEVKTMMINQYEYRSSRVCLEIIKKCKQEKGISVNKYLTKIETLSKFGFRLLDNEESRLEYLFEAAKKGLDKKYYEIVYSENCINYEDLKRRVLLAEAKFNEKSVKHPNINIPVVEETCKNVTSERQNKLKIKETEIKNVEKEIKGTGENSDAKVTEIKMAEGEIKNAENKEALKVVVNEEKGIELERSGMRVTALKDEKEKTEVKVKNGKVEILGKEIIVVEKGFEAEIAEVTEIELKNVRARNEEKGFEEKKEKVINAEEVENENISQNVNSCEVKLNDLQIQLDSPQGQTLIDVAQGEKEESLIEELGENLNESLVQICIVKGIKEKMGVKKMNDEELKSSNCVEKSLNKCQKQIELNCESNKRPTRSNSQKEINGKGKIKCDIPPLQLNRPLHEIEEKLKTLREESEKRKGKKKRKVRIRKDNINMKEGKKIPKIFVTNQIKNGLSNMRRNELNPSSNIKRQEGQIIRRGIRRRKVRKRKVKIKYIQRENIQRDKMRKQRVFKPPKGDCTKYCIYKGRKSKEKRTQKGKRKIRGKGRKAKIKKRKDKKFKVRSRVKEINPKIRKKFGKRGFVGLKGTGRKNSPQMSRKYRYLNFPFTKKRVGKRVKEKLPLLKY